MKKATHTALARRWRPPDFDHLIGQQHISRTLMGALKNNRLPQALIFSGPRGTGKTSSARILAKLLRCQNSPYSTREYALGEASLKKGEASLKKIKKIEICGATSQGGVATSGVATSGVATSGVAPPCEECRQIASSTHMDVMEIDGASHNGVEAVRELRQQVNYPASSGFFKIYIIDEVHMLSTAAFNALLKTLEEPPEHVVFILATTEEHKILPTVRSRCQSFTFRRLSAQHIQQHLQHICKSEAYQVDNEALWLVARLADGSMRDAQSLLDQVLSFSQPPITAAQVEQVLGLIDANIMLQCVEALVLGDEKKMLHVVEKIMISGYDALVFLRELIKELRNLLLITINQAQLTDKAEKGVENLKTLSQHINAAGVQQLFNMALKGAQDLYTAQDPPIVLEMLLLRMVSRPQQAALQQAARSKSTITAPPQKWVPPKKTTVDVPNYADRLKPHEATPGSNKTAQTATAPPADSQFALSQAATSQSVFSQSATAPPADSQFEAPQAASSPPAFSQSATAPPADSQSASSPSRVANWRELVKKIHKLQPRLSATLQHVHFVKCEDKVLHLKVSSYNKFIVDTLQQQKDKIENYVNTFWGQGHRIHLTTGTVAQASTLQGLQEQKKQQERDDLREQVSQHPLVQAAQKAVPSQIVAIKD